jgi:2-polyprenyl-3-methyl-5-hydroxy-6-metoxy-1,4-benzoquinol methylase
MNESTANKIRAELNFSQLYDVAFGWSPEAELSSIIVLWEHLLPSPPMQICDIGAGTGRFTIPLLKMEKKCTAIEPDSEMGDVLCQKLKQLPTEIQNNCTYINDRIEKIDIDKKYDSILLMTDTLGYIWPDTELRRFIANVRNIVAPDAVIVVDVALWSKYAGENREESWTMTVDDVIVETTYRSTLLNMNTSRSADQELIRKEEFTLTRISGQDRLTAYREGALHAFSLKELCAVWQELGFEPMLYVKPGSSEVMSIIDEVPPRLFIAFQQKDKV